jgi:hypothetical protein
MNAISSVLSYAVPETSAEARPFRTIALFCSMGLVASLCLATSSIELSAYLY